ncbi:histone deacetylase family protein [Halomonas sp. 18H]|uniref:histone deacetylase family protein n=1 Tax=Halomonas almeriensis TaxID=308163 RepID=UPI0022325154|nr:MULTISPECIES: histone deacetylase family protein [Halomonas]MCW4151891.1 histone deacetylase family protein [Halomonas sp. 18H]MDN3554137.1 histone deacetylase family protein [Halomonas almeriensis]
MITAYITHPDHPRHFMGPGHPESPKRLDAIQARLKLTGLLQQTMQCEATEASNQQLYRVHPAQHLRYLENCNPCEGVQSLDGDTLMTPDSLRIARLAAGAAIKGVDRVYRHQADNVFCAMRPPGHHAEASKAMGFCFFNNVAVAAAHARNVHAAQRVAILDFDVHQGNGTIDIFQNDPSVLVCSSFQSPFYPWRYLESTAPNIINTPLPSGSDGAAFRRAIEADWLPALHHFQPDLVLLSAGFDAHREDPLGELNLTPDDFYWVTRLAMEVAERYADKRLVSVLEGGYAGSALGLSVEAHLKALLGLPPG